MKPIDVLYLCDGKQCYAGSPCQNEDCEHTHDINYALHKDDLEGRLFKYVENGTGGRIGFFEVKESEERIMREPIKMKGRVLLFDKVDKLKTMFPKNCDITYSEIVPIVWNFEFNKPDMVLGNVKISKDDDGLICDAVINNPSIQELLDAEDGELHIGGYYKKIKEHDHNGVRMIDQAYLVGIGVTLAPALDELKLVLVESEE